jgi:DNA-binding transcriptional LysR family regulator
MEENYLNLLNHFRVLAEFMDHKKAAEFLNISYAGMTKSIRNLENKLGVKLFQKSRWRISLTHEGKIFLDHVKVIFEDIEKAERSIQKKEHGKTSQELTILTTPGLAGQHLYQLHYLLRTDYPNIKLNLLTSTDEYNLDEEKFDLYVGPEITSFTGVTSKIKDMHFKFYATPSYQESYGLPCKIDDLKNHHFVQFSFKNTTFFKESSESYGFIEKNASLITNSFLVEYRLVQEGKSIALLSEDVVRAHKIDIIDVFPDMKPHTFEIYAQYKKNIKPKLLKYLLLTIKNVVLP